MKTYTFVTLTCLLSFLATPVSPALAAEHSHNHHGAHGNHKTAPVKTQIKVVNGIQVALDFNTMAEHKKMMTMMGMKMSHSKLDTHYLTVTLSDKKTKRIIKNALVKAKVIGPDKKAIGPKSGSKMNAMSGMGMHHYGHGFHRHQKGQHAVILLFKVKGKIHQTVFHIQ